MKYDIAKNEDGPLRKTLHSRKPISAAVGESGSEQAHGDASREPGLDERLRNIEAHLAVRYGQLAIDIPKFRIMTGPCSSLFAEVLHGPFEVS